MASRTYCVRSLRHEPLSQDEVMSRATVVAVDLASWRPIVAMPIAMRPLVPSLAREASAELYSALSAASAS